MEVHHHAHSASGETHSSDPDKHRARKKWTHYFWEFLMLFLAVFNPPGDRLLPALNNILILSVVKHS
jgi:hypothetical protein